MDKYERERLNKVTGKWVRGCYKDLKKEGCGCCSLIFGNSGNHDISVCVGWHNLGDGPEEENFDHWVIAWKIGWQTFDNYMQTDLDIDFDMPWNTKEYCDKMNAKLTEEEKRRGTKYCEGDVYDTEEVIELKPGKTTPAGYRDWNALAAFIRKTARAVLAYAREVDPEENDD